MPQINNDTWSITTPGRKSTKSKAAPQIKTIHLRNKDNGLPACGVYDTSKIPDTSSAVGLVTCSLCISLALPKKNLNRKN